MATVHLANLRRFEAAPGSVLLDAAAAAGLTLEHSCRTGRCGSCRAHVDSGSTTVLRAETGLAAGDAQAGWILTCARGADSDLKLDIEDLGALAGIVVKTLPSRIDAIERLSNDIVKIRLRLPPTAALRWLPGQAIDVIGPGGERRSYSIANATGPMLELLIRRVPGGLLSDYWFKQAQLGDLLRFEGPRGSFHLRNVAGLDLVMLATGTGIAPIKAILEELAARPQEAQPRSVRLLWGARKQVDLCWAPSLPGLHYTPVLSRADASWHGARGHVQDVLLQSPPEWQRCAVYACGSPAMIATARSVLPAKHFYSDAFVASAPVEAVPA